MTNLSRSAERVIERILPNANQSMLIAQVILDCVVPRAL